MPAMNGTVKHGASPSAAEARVGSDDARLKFGEMIDRAWDGERIVVTRHDRERAVLIGWREYEQLRALERKAK